jgi:hypothetical protein
MKDIRDMNRLIRCPSFTLKHEKHLKNLPEEKITLK